MEYFLWENNMFTLEKAKKVLSEKKQEHILKYFDTLTEEQKETLLKQIENINWADIQMIGKETSLTRGEFSVPPAVSIAEISQKKEEYLGTIQTFFLISGLYASLMRLMSGIITFDLLPLIIVGIIMCLIGKKTGTVFVDKISDEKMRKLIYIFLGIVGIIKLFECIL